MNERESVYRDATPGRVLQDLILETVQTSSVFGDTAYKISGTLMSCYDAAVEREFETIQNGNASLKAEYRNQGYRDVDGALTLHMRNGEYVPMSSGSSTKFRTVVVHGEKSDHGNRK